MNSKWIDGKLHYKNEFRYIATVIRRTVPRLTIRGRAAGAPAPQLELDLFDSAPTVRRFGLRKDAEKWLSYERTWGARASLDVRSAWIPSVW